MLPMRSQVFFYYAKKNNQAELWALIATAWFKE
jgi:hypothetical protein